MSTKKMHPPAVIHPTTGQTGGKGSLLPVACGKTTAKDRQNVENIVPSQNGTLSSAAGGGGGAEPQPNVPQNPLAAGKKAAPIATKTAVAPAVNPATAVQSRRKNHRHSNMSPSRKRQEQQSIFNNLRAWNVNIVTSGGGGVAPQEKRPAPVTSSNEAKAAAPVTTQTDKSSSTVVNGTATSSSSSSNTSSSSSISNVTSSNSISGSVKAKKQQSQLMAAVTVPVAVAATVKVEQQKKVEVGVATEHQAVTACKKDAAPSSVGSSTACEAAAAGKADGKTAGTGSKTAGAVAATAIKEERKLLNGGANGFGGRQSLAIPPPPPPSSLTAPPSSLSASAVGSGSSLLHPSSSSSIPVVSSTGSCSSSKHNSRASNAGKVLLPNVNPLDQFAVLQGKLRNSMSAPPPPAQQSHHNIPHHPHSSVAHNHQQQSQQQQLQQQQSIPSTTTTSPQYSLDFLHYVGMRMSGSGGTTPQSTATAAAQAAALFRGNPHFNYSNFNQQLHPQQPSQQQQQQHHLQRHFSGYYEEMMVPAGSTGGGDAGQLYNGAAGYPGVDHLVNGAAAAVGNGGAGDSMAYCYSQNHQHNHHAHQHQHNHPPHQQQQQQQPTSGYGNGGFHQNNNYQQHNRNYGGGRGGQSNGGNMQGRKTWNNNNNSWHGKRSNMMQGGKFGGVGGIKGPNMSHGGYRKSYHYYNNNNNNSNHHHHHTNGHHHDPHQQQHQDQMRNLVYIRGYDRGQGAASSSQESTSRSPTPSPQSESPAIDTASEVVKTSSSTIAGSSGSSVQDEKSDSGIEDGAVTLKKSGAVPSSSSSSSSVVSIPSTDSSAISSAASQNLSLELNSATGQGYESDSSHSSSYNSHTYRHRKYANGGQVYRSSSSTSSGVSSTATFPPLVVDFAMQTSSASAVNTPTASATSQQVADFFLRSQSYHGSHQNLTTVSGSASPNPPDSPVGAARPLVGTQSMPMFSELFTGQQHHNHHQQQNQQRTHPNSSYGSNSSLDSTLQNVVEGTPASVSASSNNSNCSIVSTTSSSGYGSAPASTVPPNEAYSMQSGHPRRRFSGRSSPAPYTEQSHKPNRSSFGGSNTAVNSSSQQPPSPPSHNRKGQQPAWSTHRPVTVPTSATTTTTTAIPPAPQVPPPSTSVPPPSNTLPLLHPIDGTNYHTPADRFLARSHLVELLAPPEDLAPAGSKWAALSSAVWDKFAATQQTQHKFVQKIQLWRYLFMCIRKAFPRFSLYLVGSTISGFASDNSDVDMCLVCRANTIPFDMRGEALFQLGQLKNYFMNINTYFEEFSVIQAKVPILRFRDSTNCIVVDLNYNNCVGIRNTHLLYCYSQLDWRLRPLTLVVKLWAQHHNINDAKNMTISSYSLVLMVIHFLQYGVSPPILPCLHAMYPDKFVRMSDISNLDLTETMEPYKNENAQSLGELFMQFLEYYANFDYTQYAISVRTASVIPIESARVARSYKNDPHHWRQLCIEEPFDLTNTARSVFDADIFEQIKSVFSTSWRRLKDTNDLGSIFECDPLFVPVASTLSITS